MPAGEQDHTERGARIMRRDRHGRGLRGVLAPPGVPLHRTRAERFDDLVLQAVARLEPRWEAQLAGVEFGVEEIPPAPVLEGRARGPVPLGRLDPGSSPEGDPGGGLQEEALVSPGEASGSPGEASGRPGEASGLAGGGTRQRPARIVVYRRPLMARADGEDDLSELVFDVVVEEFARLLGIDPDEVDPGYGGGE